MCNCLHLKSSYKWIQNINDTIIFFNECIGQHFKARTYYLHVSIMNQHWLTTWSIITTTRQHHSATYLPSIIAKSFCRGLSTSQMKGAGRALTGVEVWKCPHCVRTRPGRCRSEVTLGLLWKQSVLPLAQNERGEPVWVALRKAEFVVPRQLIWEDTEWSFFRGSPTRLHTGRFRGRYREREQKRLFLNKPTQSRTIVPAVQTHLKANKYLGGHQHGRLLSKRAVFPHVNTETSTTGCRRYFSSKQSHAISQLSMSLLSVDASYTQVTLGYRSATTAT